MVTKKNMLVRLTMPLPELESYYRQRRQVHFENNKPFRGVNFRKYIHQLLLIVLKIKHLLSKEVITIIGDKHIPTNHPVIFAATHIGWDDIEMIFSAIRTHAYLFLGDPRNLYRSIDGFLLDLNGAICMDTSSKSDRYVGKETCVRWLMQGGNLLIFPEGAWNITENLPVMPLYAGAAEMAIRSDAEIIPVAIERYGKQYVVNIGENICSTNMDLEHKWDMTAALRDTMATLRWEIWESRPKTKRTDIPQDHRFLELQELQKSMQGVYTLHDVEITRFHTQAEIAQKEAFAHLNKLIPCRENAFLYRNR